MSVAVPLLVKLTVLAAELLPTATLPKETAVAPSVTAGAPLATPLPLRLTFAVPLDALDAMARLAARLPTADGVKRAVTVHFPLAATAVPTAHVPPSAKSAAAEPDRAMPVKFNAAVPVFDTVTVCAVPATPVTWLPKLRLVALRETVACGAAAPVPDRAIVTGVVNPLWLMLSVLVRLPTAVGVKATPTVQLLLGASELPQVPPCTTKSPLTLVLRFDSAAKLLDFTVTTSAALD